MTEKEKVIDKISKLLALADCDNEHEAALAMSRANDLMKRHAIAEHEARGTHGKESLIESEWLPLGGNQKWKPVLVFNICRAFGCVSYHQQSLANGHRMRVYGTESARATVRYMHSFADSQIIRLAKLARTNSRAATIAFKRGCAYGMIETLLEIYRRNKADSTPTHDGQTFGLIRRDELQKARDALNQDAPNLGRFNARSQISDVGAYHAGKQAGRKVEFSRPVNGGYSKLIS